MTRKKIIPIKTVVSAYMKCGKRNGFCAAELRLMRFLPASNPDGKCCDVPKNRRAELIKALNK